MTQVLNWLDNSAEEQRRVTEIISYFTEGSTVDEVSIGQLRDALSDLLFPCTSTLHTRARYLLIVPWCNQQDGNASGLALERSIIPRLASEEGAFGGRSGSGLKRLPSDAYWSAALRAYGILQRDGRQPTRRGQPIPLA